MSDFIPVSEPLLDGDEKKNLIECIDSGWISSEGPFVSEFENRFAARMQRKHGIAVSNGTAAIDIAIDALDIGPGDEVILPAFTIISCINQIVRSGAVPVLVDADSDTWNMDVGQVEAKVSHRTKAVLVVHIYGLPVDMDPLLSIADKYGLKVIEDAAEAHGQQYKDRACGSFGDISTFSFYPNKNVTTGEGGMIVTDNDDLADACRQLRNLCFQPERRFVHERLGWNYRMTNLQAAVGLAQLKRLDDVVLRKRAMGALYTRLLEEERLLQLPLAETEYATNAYWVYGLVLSNESKLEAESALEQLRTAGVGGRPFFYPMHKQPVLRRLGLFEGENYPVAENLARRGLYLPSGVGITEAKQRLVAEAVKKIII